MSSEQMQTRAIWRTPRAAAVAGLVFAVTIATVIVLMRLASPLRGDPTEWILNHTRRQQVTIAVSLVPYAGIAFLWFIGVIRARIGAREDKLFATVFLGSGLLFIAMLFAGAATIGATLASYGNDATLAPGTVHLMNAVSAQLLTTFAIRMAAVFTLVTTNLGRRAGLVPKWLFIVGLVAGIALLFVPIGVPWGILVFPAWVAVLSVYILVATGGADEVTA